MDKAQKQNSAVLTFLKAGLLLTWHVVFRNSVTVAGHSENTELQKLSAAKTSAWMCTV